MFPVALGYEFFKQGGGLYDGAEIAEVSLQKLKEIFDPDAILFLDIEDYGTSYTILASTTRITLKTTLMSAKTGKILWRKKTKLIYNPNNSSDLITAIISALVNQIVNSISDTAFDVANIGVGYNLSTDCPNCILNGPYSPNFKKDNLKEVADSYRLSIPFPYRSKENVSFEDGFEW